MVSRVFRQAALNQLSSAEQLDQPIRILDPRSWAALAGSAVLVLAGFGWCLLGRISDELVADGLVVPVVAASQRITGIHPSGSQALLFVAPGTGPTLRPGLQVTLQIAGLPVDEYRPLRGVVTHLALVETRLCQHGSSSPGPCIEVAVSLPDSRLVSHQGGELALTPGLRVSGRILVGRDHPIALLLPGLRHAHLG